MCVNLQVELTRTLPPYVIVPNEGEVSVANVMLAAMSDDGVVTDGYSTLLLTLMMENSSIPVRASRLDLTCFDCTLAG